MASVISAFAVTFARAAGFVIKPDGDVCRQDETVYRLGSPLDSNIDDGVYFEFIDWICDQCEDTTELVFNYADAFRIDEMGAFGLAAKSAPTMRDTLTRLERYFKLITDTAVYRLDERGGQAFLTFVSLSLNHRVLHIRDECAMAAVARGIKNIGQPGMKLDHVSFRHTRRDNYSRFEAFFDCDVRFGADQTEIALQRTVLNEPNRLGDRGVSDFLTQHLDQEMARLTPQSPLAEEVVRHVSNSLSDGVPLAIDIARRMGMSERTLYRRLADESLSYRDVVQNAQSALARELLSQTKCSISEIAFLTGFSEQSTFSRAFKRWMGEAPARYRQLS